MYLDIDFDVCTCKTHTHILYLYLSLPLSQSATHTHTHVHAHTRKEWGKPSRETGLAYPPLKDGECFPPPPLKSVHLFVPVFWLSILDTIRLRETCGLLNKGLRLTSSTNDF